MEEVRPGHPLAVGGFSVGARRGVPQRLVVVAVVVGNGPANLLRPDRGEQTLVQQSPPALMWLTPLALDARVV